MIDVSWFISSSLFFFFLNTRTRRDSVPINYFFACDRLVFISFFPRTLIVKSIDVVILLFSLGYYFVTQRIILTNLLNDEMLP